MTKDLDENMHIMRFASFQYLLKAGLLNNEQHGQSVPGLQTLTTDDNLSLGAVIKRSIANGVRNSTEKDK